jgi:hypothetical protein
VALIDMTTISRNYYATVANPATLFADSGTHPTEIGAIGIAAAAGVAIKASSLPLKDYVK